MTLYSPEMGLAAGIGEMINDALLTAIDPQRPFLQQLLNGYSKSLSLEWNGEFSTEALLDGPDPRREDGILTLHTRPDDPLRKPPVGLNYETLNIRMGVPLWIYGWHNRQKTVIASGLLHPFFTSATIDVWSPETGLHERRLYVHDPRITDEELEEMPPQLRRQAEMAKLESINAGLPRERPPVRPTLE